MSGALALDVVSDVVCPWCFIGKRRLAAALALRPAVAVDLRWRPFQLDATIPPEGIPRRDYLARKFGPERIAAIHERLEQAGREAGIAFAFDRIAVSPNTLDAHRLIRWSAAEGAQEAIVEALFSAYFTQGRDIGDRAVLADIAGECGLDAVAVRRRLDGDADVEAVRQEIASAVRIGVQGVPFFILDGRFAVSGAQTPEVLAGAIDQARAAEA